MKRYRSHIPSDGIYQLCKDVLEHHPRASTLIILTLITAVKNQGSHPASIMLEVCGDSNSSGVDVAIRRLCKMDYLQLTDAPTRPARQQVWVTSAGAEKLKLDPL